MQSTLSHFSCTKKRSAAANTLAELSVLRLAPVLHTFLFIAEHPSVDIHKMFTFQSMDTFSLGTSHLLKELFLDYFQYFGRVSKTITKIESVNTFKEV